MKDRRAHPTPAMRDDLLHPTSDRSNGLLDAELAKALAIAPDGLQTLALGVGDRVGRHDVPTRPCEGLEGSQRLSADRWSQTAGRLPRAGVKKWRNPARQNHAPRTSRNWPQDCDAILVDNPFVCKAVPRLLVQPSKLLFPWCEDLPLRPDSVSGTAVSGFDHTLFSRWAH